MEWKNGGRSEEKMRRRDGLVGRNLVVGQAPRRAFHKAEDSYLVHLV